MMAVTAEIESVRATSVMSAGGGGSSRTGRRSGSGAGEGMAASGGFGRKGSWKQDVLERMSIAIAKGNHAMLAKHTRVPVAAP